MSFAFQAPQGATTTADIAAQVADGNGNDNKPMPVHYNDFKLEKIEEKTFDSGAMKLSFWLRITGEKYANKVVFQDYFVIKKDGTQNNKAFEQINAMAHAMGVTDIVTDPQMLVGRKFAGKVIIKKSDNPQYPDDTNEINPFEYHPVGYRGKNAQGSASISGNSFAAPAGNAFTSPQTEAPSNAFAQPQAQPQATADNAFAQPQNANAFAAQQPSGFQPPAQNPAFNQQ